MIRLTKALNNHAIVMDLGARSAKPTMCRTVAVTFGCLALLAAIPGLTVTPGWAQTDLEAAIAARSEAGPVLAAGQAPGDSISFESDGRTLQGVVYRPAGDGPFPAVIWNHDAADPDDPSNMSSQPELAAFYNAHGFVFFHPFRRGVGPSPGDHFAVSRAVHGSLVVQLSLETEDVAAALAWLRGQSFVDPDRIVMSGVGLGAAHTLWIIPPRPTETVGVAGFVAFAPFTTEDIWTGYEPAVSGFAHRVGTPSAIFLLTATNDYSTAPLDRLGPVIEQKGSISRATIYPDFGTSSALGHDAFATWDLGTQVWGDDVLAFIEAAFARD